MILQKEFWIAAEGETARAAADVLAEEWENRFGLRPPICDCPLSGFGISLVIGEESEAEDYTVSFTEGGIILRAHRLRGLIYAIGRVLRNLTAAEDDISVMEEATGHFSPCMPMRGHGIGYTDMSNSYEAWSGEQLRRYLLELMYFGLNTVETSYSTTDKRTPLMQYDFREAFIILSQHCARYDLDLTVYYGLSKARTDEETVTDMLAVYGDMPKITALFIPGGDPGDLLPEDFLRRCIKIKQAFAARYPDIKLYPSAQAPHEYPDWRERFSAVMAACPAEIDGIIYGPNHAMPLDDLRRTVDIRYPLQHYPDITHNVRCETPVHFPRDDWHFAWAATLSRESVNPRPREYRILHQHTRQYVEGQISYSEGVHDDVNKAVWSGLDFDFYAEPVTLLQEYSRLFFCGVDSNAVANGILGLEQNWACDPLENACVEPTYALFSALAKQHPALGENCRFGLLLFRAACDKIVRDRRIFETALLRRAEKAVEDNRLADAAAILETPFGEEYRTLRSSLLPMAEKLFAQIGIQLDVARFGGMNWERGCVLDTIDMPVTDRKYLLQKLQAGVSQQDLLRMIHRNKPAKNEYYFSFALHGFDVCGEQSGEFYMDFKGDQNADGAIPMCLTKNYDHLQFKTSVAGLTGGNYRLRITYKSRNHEGILHHRVAINGHVLYDGPTFGGIRDEAYEALLLPCGYQSIVYDVPAEYLQNGCAVLEISEPTVGFVMPEFRLERA